MMLDKQTDNICLEENPCGWDTWRKVTTDYNCTKFAFMKHASMEMSHKSLTLQSTTCNEFMTLTPLLQAQICFIFQHFLLFILLVFPLTSPFQEVSHFSVLLLPHHSLYKSPRSNSPEVPYLSLRSLRLLNSAGFSVSHFILKIGRCSE